jgi:hypothetical protein
MIKALEIKVIVLCNIKKATGYIPVANVDG